MSHPFDKRRVTLAPHDFLVYPSRAVGAHRLARHELTVDGKLEVLERCAFGEREDVVSFAEPASPIYECLSDFVAKHTIDEIGADMTGLLDDSLPLSARRAWASGRAGPWYTGSRYEDPLTGSECRKYC